MCFSVNFEVDASEMIDSYTSIQHTDSCKIMKYYTKLNLVTSMKKVKHVARRVCVLSIASASISFMYIMVAQYQ